MGGVRCNELRNYSFWMIAPRIVAKLGNGDKNPAANATRW